MNRLVYRYTVRECVPLDDIEATLLLAIWSVEALYGAAPVRLESAHLFDRERRVCVIDAGSRIGRALSRLVVGLLTRQFGVEAVEVRRLPRMRTRVSCRTKCHH